MRIHWILLGLYLCAPALAAFTVAVDPSVQHQTWNDWEVSPGAGEYECPGQPLWQDTVVQGVVNDFGVTRVRLGLFAGTENSRDFWADYLTQYQTDVNFTAQRAFIANANRNITNDNNDPYAFDWQGFQFSHLDEKMRRTIIPMKQLVEARGETFRINLIYGGFGSAGSIHHTNPQEYAELVAAAFIHMNTTFGIVPDYVEIILEPENAWWSSGASGAGVAIANNLQATETRLAQYGWHPQFIVPSNAFVDNSAATIDAMMAIQGTSAMPILEFAYHGYGGNTQARLQGVRTRAQQYGIQTSMLEFTTATDIDLHRDLTEADVSSWQKYAIAYCSKKTAPGNGGIFYSAYNADPFNPVLTVPNATRLLQQYTKYIRPGAVRVDATANTANANAVAFINTGNKPVVVIKTYVTGPVTITGLPAATYGATYTFGTATNLGAYGQTHPDQTITTGQALTFPMTSAGIITVYAKTATVCTDTTWTPASGTRCGTFPQTSNCGTTRQASGTLTCSGSTPACGPANTCVQCTTASHCPSGQTCVNNGCTSTAPVCGNGLCESGETSATCPGDCPLDTTKPSAPSNLLASSISTSTVTLSWTAATDNVGIGAYRLYRNGTGNIANTTTTTYTVTNLAPRTSYRFLVEAIDTSGNIGPFAQVNVTTSAPKTGDLTGDGIVDNADLTLVLAKLGRTGSNTEDVNGDRSIDVFDLVMLVKYWG